MDFNTYFNNQMQWANSTFPTANKHSIITHLRRELEELEANNTDRLEFADCMMLLLHYADKMGMNSQDVLKTCQEKLDICKQRKWKKPDEHGVCHHVKEDMSVDEWRAQYEGSWRH